MLFHPRHWYYGRFMGTYFIWQQCFYTDTIRNYRYN